MMNGNSIMLGFDADAKKCGLALYDVKNNDVLEYVSMHYNNIYTWLDKVVKEHGESLYARVEVGDKKTAYGGSSYSQKTNYKSNQKQTFSTVFDSGGNSMIAKLFVNLLESHEIRYEVINSSSRFNIRNRKLPLNMKSKGVLKYCDLSPEELKKAFVRLPNIFPSKLSGKQITSFFKLKKEGNPETRDALSLMIPELIRFNYKK